MNYNNNNNNIDNIDNNLNQQHQQYDNEILFWKVFHNKYLLYVIFEKIENALVIGERKKFKDFTSLYWLIQHKQYSLLKCKLEAGDHIEVCEDSLSLLFNGLFKKIENSLSLMLLLNQFFKETENKENTKEIDYTLSDEYKDHENNVKISELNQINLKQSIYLLLKYKPKELLQIQLFNIIVNNKYETYNQMILEELIDHLLSTEPYCNDLTLINSDTIKPVIKSFPPSILSKLLNHVERINTFNTVITDNIKNTSISLVGSGEYMDSMLEFILNNNQLYNIPQLPSSSSSLDKVSKLDILEFLLIKSSTIQNTLLHLNYVGSYYISDEFEMKLKVLLNNDNYIGSSGNGEDNGTVRINEIHKLVLSQREIRNKQSIFFQLMG